MTPETKVTLTIGEDAWIGEGPELFMSRPWWATRVQAGTPTEIRHGRIEQWERMWQHCMSIDWRLSQEAE